LTAIAIGTEASVREETLRTVTTAAAPSELRRTLAASTLTSALSRVMVRPLSTRASCAAASLAVRSSLALFSCELSHPLSASTAMIAAAPRIAIRDPTRPPAAALLLLTRTLR